MNNLLAVVDLGSITPPNPEYAKPDSIFGIGTIVQNGLVSFYTIMGLVLLGYVLYGGVKWLIAGGDKDNLESAKQTLTNAFIGMVILVLAIFITEIGTGVLGIPSPFSISIPTLIE